MTAFGWSVSSPVGAQVAVSVDTSLAERMLALTCSNAPIDRAEFADSPSIRAQLAHQRRFGEAFTIDNYIKGVEATAACRVGDPDPFRFAALVNKRDKMTRAIRFLAERREDLGREVNGKLSPYVPKDFKFTGSVVLAPATFSCGGFARDGRFFIDIPCIADDVEGEYQAITSLTAHETYHAIQQRIMRPLPVSYDTIASPAHAQALLFSNLAMEGSATFVAEPGKVVGSGTYAKFMRTEAHEGRDRLAYTASLLDFVVELLAQPSPDLRNRSERLYTLVFGGQLGQPGYYLGQHMAAEIVADFGSRSIPCLLGLGPEQFTLAYAEAYTHGRKLETSVELGHVTIAAAEALETTVDRAARKACLAA